MNNQVTVLSGAVGVIQAYERVLQAKKVDIVCLSQDYEVVLGDYFERVYAPKLYGKVTTRELLPDTADNREYAKGKDARVNQVRFTPMKPTNTDFMVTESMVVVISFAPESPQAVVIQEPEVVSFFGEVFEKLYAQAQN